MSKQLARLLGKTDEEVSRIIHKLEALSGYAREDIRLCSEVESKAASQLRSLGLDPLDTTNRELQAALRVKLQADSMQLSKAVGLNKTSGVDSSNLLMTKLVGGIAGSAWGVKKHIAKDLLELAPPKKVMKKFGYRSVQSMLKRENIIEIYAAASVLESTHWQQNFWKKHSGLKPSDFEFRHVELIVMPTRRWETLAISTGLVTCILPLGAAVVWPRPGHTVLTGASVAVLLLEALEHIKIYSCALRLEQMNNLFGQKVLEFMRPNIISPAKIEDVSLDWNVLHRHYGTHPADKLPFYFEPHLTTEDLHQNTTSEQMAKLNPAFSWWAGNDFVAFDSQGQHTSMNLGDVVASNLSKREVSHGLGKLLWSELVGRYMHHQGVEEHVASRLDNASAEKENIGIRAIRNRQSPLAMVQAEFA